MKPKPLSRNINCVYDKYCGMYYETTKFRSDRTNVEGDVSFTTFNVSFKEKVKEGTGLSTSSTNAAHALVRSKLLNINPYRIFHYPKEMFVYA